MCGCAKARSVREDTETDGAGGAGSTGAPGVSLPSLTRRSAFGAVGGGAVAGLLSACGDGAAGGDGPAGGPGDAVATTGEVPVGEGTVLADQRVVVTQPEEGTFRAFSVTCTHEGCPVDEVADGEINCPCHGSRFSIEDGSPVEGPAESPLEEIQINVDGDQITLA